MEGRATRNADTGRLRPSRSEAPLRRPVYDQPAPARAHQRVRSGGQKAALAAIIALALLCAAFLATVEIVRRSAYLQTRVLDEVAAITGLPAQSGEVDISWGGTTTIHDLTLRLPIGDEPVLESPAMTIEHRSLMGVILLRDVEITAIDIAQPTLIAAQRDGDWTLVEAIERIAAHVRGRPDDGGDGSFPELPQITARRGQLTAIPEEGERFTLPLDVVCEPGRLRYTIDATLGDSRARLTLALGGDWRHGLDAQLAPSPELWAQLGPQLGAAAPAARDPATLDDQQSPPAAAINWEGRATSDGLAGELQIGHARYRDLVVTGSVRARQAENSGTVIEIARLALERQQQRLELTSGQLRARGQQFEVQRAQFVAGQGGEDLIGGAIEGSMNLDRQSGELTARFFGGWPGGSVEHEGTLVAQVRSPGGFPEVSAQLDASGRAGDTEIDLDAQFDASGRGWDDMLGRLSVASLALRRGGDTWQTGPLQLEGLLLEDRLMLTWFNAQAAERSSARGGLNLDTMVWDLDLEASGWSLGPMAQDATLGVDAGGEAGNIESWRAALETAAFSALGSGAYSPGNPEPVVASVVIATGGEAGNRDGPRAELAARAARAADDPPQRGLGRLLRIDRDASLELELRGTLDPLRLAGASVLRTQPVSFDDPAEELTLAGRAELAGGELRVTADEFQAFDGACTLGIAATGRDGLVVTLDCRDLSLAALADFAELGTEAQGAVGANLRARWPRENRSQLVVDGAWEAQELKAGLLEADAARGKIEIAEGDVRLRQVLVSRGKGRLRGSLDTDIATWRQVWVDLESDGYLVQVGDVDLALTGDVEGSAALSQWTGAITASVSSQVARAGADLGWIEANAALDGRLLTVQEVEGELAGGTVRGWATVPLDEWTALRSAMRLEGVSTGQLVTELEQVQGNLSGVIAAGPSESAQAHAPLRIAGQFTLDDGSLRGMTIGNIDIEGYVGHQRAVLDRALVQVAGGTLELWASTNDHDGDRYIQASGKAADMDLDLLVHALAPEAEPYPGRISATFGGAGYLGSRDRMFGEARVAVRRADLLNLPLIAELHEVLALGGGGGRGEGEAIVRLEGAAVRVPEASYFNGGTEVRLSLHMADVWQGGDSPIAGGAVAWLRPLEASPLPLTDVLDRLFAGVQAGGTSVRISGTAGDPDTREVPLQELQSLLGRALGAGE